MSMEAIVKVCKKHGALSIHEVYQSQRKYLQLQCKRCQKGYDALRYRKTKLRRMADYSKICFVCKNKFKTKIFEFEACGECRQKLYEITS